MSNQLEEVGNEEIGRRIVVVEPNYPDSSITYIQPKLTAYGGTQESITLAENPTGEYTETVIIP